MQTTDQKAQPVVDANWLLKFQKRMEQFGNAKIDGFVPLSVKVRPTGGCFHHSCCPYAIRQIHRYLGTADLSDVRYKFEEHESGPEILVWLAVGAAGLGFAKSVVELITQIIKARSDGIKNGDRHREPLELLVRGHTKDGEYFEEVVLRVPHENIITAKQVEDALAKVKPPTQRKRRKK